MSSALWSLGCSWSTVSKQSLCDRWFFFFFYNTISLSLFDVIATFKQHLSYLMTTCMLNFVFFFCIKAKVLLTPECQKNVIAFNRLLSEKKDSWTRWLVLRLTSQDWWLLGVFLLVCWRQAVASLPAPLLYFWTTEEKTQNTTWWILTDKNTVCIQSCKYIYVHPYCFHRN